MPIAPEHTVYADDIFLWRDGFWCFRIEHRREVLRDDDYYVIARDDNDWSVFLLNLLQRQRPNLDGTDDVPESPWRPAATG